jgi:hypothetical protein
MVTRVGCRSELEEGVSENEKGKNGVEALPQFVMPTDIFV